jgi:prolipoprotein diacylglyceryltransferase
MQVLQVFFLIVWTIVTLFVTVFSFWRRLVHEHIDSEDQVVDKAFLAAIAGLIASRVVYGVFHLSTFGSDISKWIAVWMYPGMTGVVALVVGLVVLLQLLKDTWRDRVEIVDFASISLSLFLFFSMIADILLQALYLAGGMVLQEPVVTPSIDARSLLISGILAVVYLGLFVFLSWVEKRYRTFLWYRSRRRSAQTGFLVGCFLIAYGGVGFISGWVTPSSLNVFGVGLDPLLKLLVMVGGFVVLYVRSGRSLFKR